MSPFRCQSKFWSLDQFMISQPAQFSISSLTPLGCYTVCEITWLLTGLDILILCTKFSETMATAAWFRSGSQLTLFMLTSLFFSENLCLCLFHDSFFVYLDSCCSLSCVWCVQNPYSFLQTAVSRLKLTACLPFWKKKLLVLLNKKFQSLLFSVPIF